MGRGLKGDRSSADDTGDFAADDYVLSGNHTRHLALLTDNYLRALHVSLDLSVDLQHTPTDNFQPLPDDLQVVANHRFVGRCRSVRAEQSAVCVAAIGLARRELLWIRRRGTREHGIPQTNGVGPRVATASSSHGGIVSVGSISANRRSPVH